MASDQEKMERAEAAAWQAAYDLRDVNRQREYEERAKSMESNKVPPALDRGENPGSGAQDRPGLIGSMFRAVADTVGHSKDAVVGKGHEAAEKTKDAAGQKMESAKETAKGKAGEVAEMAKDTKEAAKGKAAESMDKVADRAKDADYASAPVVTLDRDDHDRPAVAGDRPGVISSMFRAVADTVGHAKDAAVGKGQEATEKTNSAAEMAGEKAKAGEVIDTARDKKEGVKEKAGEYVDFAANKAGETKDAAKGKAEEYRNYAADKAGETKDAAKGKAEEEYKKYTADKAREANDKAWETKEAAKGKAEEYKNYAAEKAGQTKDYTVEKAREAKDYTAADKANEAADKAIKTKQGSETAGSKLGDVARAAMDFLSGKNEQVKDKAEETAQITKEKMREAEEETRRKVEELKLQDEAEKADYQHRKEEAERGRAARDTIYGAVGIGTISDSIRSKLTQPGDVVEETLAARKRGGTGRAALE
ncbi:unnamed protein product [Linum trigynum]|uniref:Embryonic protein DC-8-like n=1 Tax=Linum trigynum TaxID=586398 RepID=A0AAV2FL68_9ROSI